MPKKILIVGGEGYIGKVLCLDLVKKYKIFSLDNLIYNQNKNKKLNLNNNYKFINFDITNISNFDELLDDVHAIVILAGLVGDPITKKYSKLSNQINLIGIKSLINKSLKNKIERLIFISTCSNYGLIPNKNYADENHILNPLSDYAKAKVEIENYILSLKGKIDTTMTILRFATAFGLSDRMRFDLTLNEFALDIFHNNFLEVFDKDTWRPYCHVSDFSNLIQIVLETKKKLINFEIFNAGSKSNHASKKILVDKILKYTQSNNIKYLENGFDPRNYKVNFNKVESILNFEAKYSIDYGINEIINALSNNKFKDVLKNRKSYGNYIIPNEKV